MEFDSLLTRRSFAFFLSLMVLARLLYGMSPFPLMPIPCVLWRHAALIYRLRNDPNCALPVHISVRLPAQNFLIWKCFMRETWPMKGMSMFVQGKDSYKRQLRRTRMYKLFLSENENSRSE